MAPVKIKRKIGNTKHEVKVPLDKRGGNNGGGVVPRNRDQERQVEQAYKDAAQMQSALVTLPPDKKSDFQVFKKFDEKQQQPFQVFSKIPKPANNLSERKPANPFLPL